MMARQDASFGRMVVVLAAVVVVLAGMHLAAPVLTPILFALFFALIFAPVYARLRCRLPTVLAPLVMLVGLGILFVGLFVLLSASIARLTGRLGFYAQKLNGKVGDFQALLDRLGLSGADLSEVVNGSAVVGAVGAILSGVAGFLSSLFLILMIVLFLPSEGTAMMDRLRASVAAENPQVARLTVIGQSVVRQFGLRDIVNPCRSRCSWPSCSRPSLRRGGSPALWGCPT